VECRGALALCAISGVLGRCGCPRCSHAHTLAKPHKGLRAQVEPTRNLCVAAGLQRCDGAHIAPVAGAIIMRHTNSLAAEAPHQPPGGPFPDEPEEFAQALRWYNSSRPVAGSRSISLPQWSHAMGIVPLGVTRKHSACREGHVRSYLPTVRARGAVESLRSNMVATTPSGAAARTLSLCVRLRYTSTQSLRSVEGAWM